MGRITPPGGGGGMTGAQLANDPALRAAFEPSDPFQTGQQPVSGASEGRANLIRPRNILRKVVIGASSSAVVSFKGFQPAVPAFTFTSLYKATFTARKNTAGSFLAAEWPFFVGAAATPALRYNGNASMANIMGTSFKLWDPGELTVTPALSATGTDLTLTIANSTTEAIAVEVVLSFYRPMMPGNAATDASDYYAWWGDSLTQGNASPAPAVLATASGMPVQNEGIGGDTSERIAARAMGLPTWLTSQVTLPTSGGIAVQMNRMTTSSSYSPKRVRIAGITGQLTVSGSSLLFTRDQAGPALILPVGTPVYYIDADPAASQIEIIWAGTNDNYGADPAGTLANIESVVKRNRRGQVLVLGALIDSTKPLGTPEHTAIVNLNAQMATRFGPAFLDIRAYLISNGLAAAGITATAQDNTDIANDIHPTSLRAAGDNLHLNVAGYTVVGNKVWAALQALGWTY